MERKVVLEEINESDDSPEILASHKIFRDSYGNLPYSRPIIGTRDSVNSITRADLVGHFENYYGTNNMLLAMAGHFDKKAALDLVESLFFRQSKKRDLKEKLKGLRSKTPYSFSSISKGEREMFVELAFKIPSTHDEDSPAIDLMSILLGESESSRFYQRLIRGGLAREAGSYAFSPTGPGIFVIRLTPIEDLMSQSLAAMMDEIKRFKLEGPSAQELERAKSLAQNELIFQEETVNGRARKFAFFESMYGDYKYERNYIESMLKVSESDLRRVAKKYIACSGMTAVALFPQGYKKGAKEKEWEEMIRKNL